MSDDTRKERSRDRTRIDTQERSEEEYWTNKFGVSEQDLKRAVEHRLLRGTVIFMNDEHAGRMILGASC